MKRSLRVLFFTMMFTLLSITAADELYVDRDYKQML